MSTRSLGEIEPPTVARTFRMLCFSLYQNLNENNQATRGERYRVHHCTLAKRGKIDPYLILVNSATSTTYPTRSSPRAPHTLSRTRSQCFNNYGIRSMTTPPSHCSTSTTHVMIMQYFSYNTHHDHTFIVRAILAQHYLDNGRIDFLRLCALNLEG